MKLPVGVLNSFSHETSIVVQISDFRFQTTLKIKNDVFKFENAPFNRVSTADLQTE